MFRLRYDRVYVLSFIFNYEKCICIYMYSVYDKKKININRYLIL